MIHLSSDVAAMRERLVAALVATAIETEEVGVLLTDDIGLCERFQRELQAIDRIVQRQRCIAGVIAATTIEEARAACSLDELTTKLFVQEQEKPRP